LFGCGELLHAAVPKNADAASAGRRANVALRLAHVWSDVAPLHDQTVASIADREQRCREHAVGECAAARSDWLSGQRDRPIPPIENDHLRFTRILGTPERHDLALDEADGQGSLSRLP
jgi:hypothetical protein